jgi:8-oxo-dGTP pyrophosphatase MutT (NUDIX family)
MSEIRRYTAAFLFVDTRPVRVLLVRKTHPYWQNGLLNGIGGEMEPGEHPHTCVSREFYEETGFRFEAWSYFCKETGPGYEVFFYRMMFSERILFNDLKFTAPFCNDKGETLSWHDVPVKEPVIGNLNWLIPMALDPRYLTNVVETSGDIRKIRTW